LLIGITLGTLSIFAQLSGVYLAYGFGVFSGQQDPFKPNRWTNTSGSLVKDNVRGLGGGLEYSVAKDFCDRLIPKFIDSPQPTCAQLRQAMQQAFDGWAIGNPYLKFVDVSDQIAPNLKPGEGSEIDYFALSASENSALLQGPAVTQRYGFTRSPVGTNGVVRDGNSYVSADISFSVDRTACWYFDPAARKEGCKHFLSVFTHETGHALGLTHPSDVGPTGKNMDTDDDPFNVISIDCQDPTKGIKFNSNFDLRAVMTQSPPGPTERSITNDDIGGRDYLYPPCPSSMLARAGNQTRPELITDKREIDENLTKSLLKAAMHFLLTLQAYREFHE
jgi:hypothetical protein